MDWLHALLLGILQGLTEFLPVSSSGHLTILSNIFGLSGEENLTFNVVLHLATVCATLFVLWHEVVWIFKDLFSKQSWKSYQGLNHGTKYAINILISMIPIAIVALFFKDTVESIFGSSIMIVGVMLLVTAFLLGFAYFAKPRQRETITPLHSFIIGIGQACAVMPGLSRSGTTIATGILLGNKKENLAQFSFLMVIPPILGEALLDAMDVVKVGFHSAMAGISPLALIVGFVAAFITGCLACKWMINIVKKGKLIYFALYCLIVGVLTICFS
ncbi:MAG: undecaprenyl-diphosphate phosphatase [Bacteroidales bacterium]|nr:undecaprenyl-diphosphate phosphatase [Bacteroidales bacterium]MDD7276286.1 undecaprenyl-diphosphate phosphatase [Bacteroidales bacterium]MDY6075327.1 undecaprenyl-diphosphate phosphatase [Bacteroidales bacterium]